MFANHPLNIINIIAGIVALTVSILILIKDVKATLNLLFFYSLAAWGVSLILNGLNFLYKNPTFGANIIVESFDKSFIRPIISSRGRNRVHLGYSKQFLC